MARNFMAVCVVCLLCADHIHCAVHYESHEIQADLLRNDDPSIEQKEHLPMLTAITQLESPRTRRKRHQSHSIPSTQEAVNISKNSKQYLTKMFERFGSQESQTLDLQGFENMLEHLGLTHLLVANTNNQPTQNCLSSNEVIHRVSSNPARGLHAPKVSKKDQVPHKHIALDDSDLNQSNYANLTQDPTGIFSGNNSERGHQFVDGVKLDVPLMYNMCPILMYYLATQNNYSCLTDQDLDIPVDPMGNHQGPNQDNDRALVWIYASASVLGVSLCGMFGFAVIPCMEKSFYNTMLQFLVALAVGTLAGDALLHLLPHAMMLSVETAGPDDVHSAMTFKGLVAVIGVIVFFGIERCLTMIAEWRKERQKKQQLPGRVRVMRDPESVSLNNSEKQCKNKYSSYPYCYDEIAMDTKDDHHHHHPSDHAHSHHVNNHEKIDFLGKHNSVPPLACEKDDPTLSFDHSQLNYHDGSTVENANVALTDSNGTYNPSKSERFYSTGSNNNNKPAEKIAISTAVDDVSSIESSRMLKSADHKPEESFTVILREHESKHHGHSHTHGHVHSPPGSLSAVAWMVVMGDGLHNFTDGMAIGAAFSNDIAGGFSTAIAVFCHELPHELGDFAVLLKAGMSAKKAVYYNFLSSILSFMGMALGICIGDTPEASAWIFAVAAGLFIYIALVDMVPELTSSHREHCMGSNTLLQLLGMSMGLLIMFLIALNEDDLKSLFTEGGGSHHHH